MFTGIVEVLGRIARIERRGERVDLQIEVPDDLARGVSVGDSISIDGCCLTVSERAGSRLRSRRCQRRCCARLWESAQSETG